MQAWSAARELYSSLVSLPLVPDGECEAKEGMEDNYVSRLWNAFKSMRQDGTLLGVTPEILFSDVRERNGEIRKTALSDDEACSLLQKNPRLQASLAALTSYTPGKWMLEKELSLRRSNKLSDADGEDHTISDLISRHGAGEQPAWSDEAGEGEAADQKARAKDVYEVAAEQKLAGLCFSGGGIRSATFCLGILQAFAAGKVLGRFDYLSTVSGGGYIHQWLAAWIFREGKSHTAAPTMGGLCSVEQSLVAPAASGGPSRSPEPIDWLRRYASYLTPRRGLFSLDTWTMLATWFRNTFLNQIVLFSFLGCCLFAIRLLISPFAWDAFSITHSALSLSLRASLVILIAASCIRTAIALNDITAPLEGVRNLGCLASFFVGPLGNRGVLLWLVLPTAFASYLLAFGITSAHGSTVPGPLERFVILSFSAYVLGLLLAVTFGGRARSEYERLTSRRGCSKCLAVSIALLTALLFSGLVWLSSYQIAIHRQTLRQDASRIAEQANQFLGRGSSRVSISVKNPSGSFEENHTAESYGKREPAFDANMVLAICAPPLCYFMLFLALRLQVGVLGRYYTESRREWLARFGGWGGILGLVWVIFALICRGGPVIFQWLLSRSNLESVVGLGFAALTHAATLYAGASGKSDGRPKPEALFGYSLLDLVGIVGAPICVLILLVTCAGVLSCLETQARPLWIFLVLLALLLFFGWRVDVNEFSMHGFYRNRLARAYLGASNSNRIPDPFTGFDDHTETRVYGSGLRLAKFLPKRFGGSEYDGPFPIFCSTLNLTTGEDIGWQERKGASFAFTPLYSGYSVAWTAAGSMGRISKRESKTRLNGYAPTREYAYMGGGVSLPTCTAISGAALSPNRGFNTQPALAFLMTLFNVRLSWWIANPRRHRVWPAKKGRPTPVFGLWYLLQEFFGLSNDTQNYVCLCDGGRFENLGLYELVRRRCRLIVICDGGMDPGPKFEDLGNAISKCRTDFGAEIKLDLKPLLPSDVTGFSQRHSVCGTIRYPAPPGASAQHAGKPGTDKPERYMGCVIYIKTSITGTETADILHHRMAHPEFPQDSTLNQWFTETEFECYRRLGEIAGEEALTDLKQSITALA